MTPDDLIKFTGATGPNVTQQATQALGMAEALVDAYTRGRHRRYGHHRPGVEAVITAVAARLLENPSQIQVREEIGPYSYYKGNGFQGLTLTELAVLNRYRKRAL